MSSDWLLGSELVVVRVKARDKERGTVYFLLVLLSDYLEAIFLAMGVLLNGKEAVGSISDDAQLFLHYY